MAEAEASPAPSTTEVVPAADTQPHAEAPEAEAVPPPEEEASVEEAPVEEAPVEEAEARPVVEEFPASAPDHKRKLEELEPVEGEEAPEKKLEELEMEGDEVKAVGGGEETVARTSNEDGTVGGDAKRQRVDGEVDGEADIGPEVQELETAPAMGNDQLTAVENIEQADVETIDKPIMELSQDAGLPQSGEMPSSDSSSLTRKIEVPNNKVGVLIGKAGDTIKFLQINSGAKIQITRDAAADPSSQTRPVELIGNLENITKAEQLIRAVIAEADAGGSPSLVARGFGTVQSGAEQVEIQVPNEKVGLIIGKGGETIKNLQTKSGARIQLIPQHLPEGDQSKERTVRVTGHKKQIESATEMINEVMNQVPTRQSQLSGLYSQQSFRPRGATPLPQWGPRVPQSQQTTGYDYPQRGTYPPQAAQYPSQQYGGYSQQPPPRSAFGTGWEQRPGAPMQNAPQTGGYDYYGQGQPIDAHSANAMPPSAQMSTAAPGSYNYGQSQGPGYGQAGPYAQSAAPQSYGHGYDEPKYDTQAPSQQYYGQQSMSSQPGGYAQQMATHQTGYAQQQPYGKSGYGAPPQGPPQSYGPPRASQPGDPMYQGPQPTSYGSGPAPQSYPYGSSAPSQQAPYGQSYGAAAGTMEGYNQPPAGYSQHGGQVAPSYGQGGQPVPAYGQQGVPSGGYGQYPSSQPAYADPSVQSNGNYYQGAHADGAYGNNVQSSGYPAAQAPVGAQAAYGQPGYTQPPSNVAGYEQTMPPPQAGYAAPAAPAGYAKSLSPQPGYAGQW